MNHADPRPKPSGTKTAPGPKREENPTMATNYTVNPILTMVF